jgi:hypothetical protein
MKKLNRIAIGVIAASVALLSGCKDGRTLELTGYVTDVHDTPSEPCEFVVPKHGQHDEEWPIEVNGKFKLEKSGEIYKFVVEGMPDSVLGKADMIVVNEKARALRYDYCNGGGRVREHPYLVGITELDQTHDEPRLRAFVYFPMRLRYQTPETSADFFYLMLMVVEDDEKDCEIDENHWGQMRAKVRALAAADVAAAGAGGAAGATAATQDSERFVSATEVRCKALQRLGELYRKQPTPGEFQKAIKKEITNIVPDIPAFQPGFHNGVIHGNF